MIRRFAFLLALATATAVAAVADAVPSKADGLPVPVDGVGPQTTVPSADGGDRYGAIPDGNRTRLLRISTDGGEIAHTTTIPGNYAVPAVALDGTPSGLAHDGETLVLIEPRTAFPRRETAFVVIDTLRLRPIERITLDGDFSFDALSPDGDKLYLVEYPSPRDYTDYAIRVYDLERQRLLPDPVLVAHEVTPDEMRGLPMTRVTSSDGRWEYTLYDGGGRRSDVPFIHSLDTMEGITHCIDLTMVGGHEASRIDLALSGDDGALSVMRGSDTLATLNTETFGLSEAPAPGAEAPAEDGGGVSGLAVGAIAAGAVLLVGTAVGLRRRRARAMPADPFGPGEPDEITAPEPERDRVAG